MIRHHGGAYGNQVPIAHVPALRKPARLAALSSNGPNYFDLMWAALAVRLRMGCTATSRGGRGPANRWRYTSGGHGGAGGWTAAAGVPMVPQVRGSVAGMREGFYSSGTRSERAI